MTRLLLLLALLCTVPLAQAQQIPVTTDSDEARVHYVRGVDALTNVDFAAARRHLDAALAADPEFAMAHLWRALLSGDAQRAEHFSHATAYGAQATDGERMMIESSQAGERDDHDAQIAMLTTLAERFPDDPMPMYIVGITEQDRDNHAQAVAAFERALVADPSFGGAYNIMGYTEMARGDMDAAERAFLTYIRVEPDHANPYDSYGDFLRTAGRLDEAEAQYEMALTKDPTFQVSRDNLTRIAVGRALVAHHAAINRRDADAATATYTATAVLAPPDGSLIVGHDAIREMMEGYFASGRLSVEGETQEIRPLGDDVAYMRTELTVRNDGAVVGRGINTYLWVDTPDGWKVARDTWTSGPVASASN